MVFPEYRPRRLRRTETFRAMIRETRLAPEQMIYPLFVLPGKGVREPVPSMPGVFRLSPKEAAKAAVEARDLGIPMIALFPNVDGAIKDNVGTAASDPDGLIPEAIRAIKDAAPEIGVMTDVALDCYTDHGHDGVLENGRIVNDATLERLAEQVQRIGNITIVIRDVPGQTNLLALNAGVEAARAGEAGRGFAVVASEVRALAQRSSEAAKEISTLIAASDEQVHSGVKLVGKTGQALSEIMGSVTEISSRVIQIAASAGEQASGIVEINAAVNQLDRTTQQTSAMFDAIHASGRSLASESAALNDAVNIFVLPSSAPDQTAIAAE